MSKTIAALSLSLLLAANGAYASSDKGTTFNFDELGARQVMTYNVRLLGGERTEIRVNGNGNSDLDLLVYDSNGTLICRDIGPTDKCGVWVLPYATGNYTIRVENHGYGQNRFSTVTW